mgnify:CR=1 FL=1
MKPIIEIAHLSKRFGDLEAVRDLSFTVREGELFAFLGVNGAGKSTTIKIMCGILTPDGGETSVYGMNIAENRVAALGKIGYVPENAPLYPEMTVFEYLHFAAALRGLRKDDLLINLAEAASQMKLAGVLNQRIETLSKGFRHRTAVAGALIHKPRILILDEPTEGLDPNQKYEMRAFIRRYGEKNIVIVSTHIMEEVENVASRILLMNRGKLISDTTPLSLLNLYPRKDMAEVFRYMTSDK